MIPFPATTPLLTTTIYDPRLPAALFRSYARLFAAAGQNGYSRVGPLDFNRELAPLLGLSHSSAHDHLRLLRSIGLIEWVNHGDHSLTIFFSTRSENPDPAESGILQAGVVGGDSLIIKEFINIHQQQSESKKPDSENQDPHSTKPCERAVFKYLTRCGVWAGPAAEIATLIAQNESRGHNTYLPGLADVLGWIAYAFADQQKNHIEHPVALLTANLKANRRCPDAYRPSRICSVCSRVEGYCRCAAGPEPIFPDKFLEFALSADYNPEAETFWGVCLECHAYPCVCTEES